MSSYKSSDLEQMDEGSIQGVLFSVIRENGLEDEYVQNYQDEEEDEGFIWTLEKVVNQYGYKDAIDAIMDIKGIVVENLKCDLCAKSKHKEIKNQWGQTFYYCTNDEPNEYNEGCVWGDRAEGKWIMANGMYYNGVVVGINNAKNAYLGNNCPRFGVSFVVSDAQTINHCYNCVCDDEGDEE